MNLIAYIDGSCIGNPGESGCGMVLKNEQGRVLVSAGWYLGHGTNNSAEYQGLIRCLKFVQKYKPERLVVYSDSQLLVNQIQGRYRVKKPHLAELHMNVLNALRNIGFRFVINHLPREQNSDADGLARKAIRIKSNICEETIFSPGHSG